MPKPQTDLLLGLSDAEADALMALGTKVRLAKGDALFRLGEPAHRTFLLMSGRITLTLPIKVRGSDEDVLIEERLAGETLGWSGLIPPHRFTLAARAAEDSELIAFPREALLVFFEKNPGTAYTVIRNVGSVIGHRLQVFQTMWIRQMQRSVEQSYS